MPVEIERKFLVRGTSWRQAATGRQLIRQGYLFTTDRLSFRVRLIEDMEAAITLKVGGAALSRGEYEYLVPVEDGRELLAAAEGREITKLRYTIPHGAHEWIVDEVLGRHAGLFLAEIELLAEDETFERPDWVGEEVTGNPRYRNAELSATGR